MDREKAREVSWIYGEMESIRNDIQILKTESAERFYIRHVDRCTLYNIVISEDVLTFIVKELIHKLDRLKGTLDEMWGVVRWTDSYQMTSMLRSQ